MPAPRSPHRQMRSPGAARRRERPAQGGRRGRDRGRRAGVRGRSRRASRPSVAEGVAVRPRGSPQTNRSRSPSGTAALVPSGSRTRPASSWTPPANRRGPIGLDEPALAPGQRAGADPDEVRRRGRDDQVRAGRRRASAGRSTIATSWPASAREDRLDRAGQRPPRWRRRGRAPRTAAAGGGPPAGAPRRRGSRAAPCSTGRPRRCPRTPIARARVSVSASTREPTTRIVPADPTSRPPERSSPSVPGLEPAAGRAAEGHDPADAAPGGPDRDPDARAGPRGRSRRTAPRAGRRCRRSRPASGRATAKTYSPPGPGARAAPRWPIQRSPGRAATSVGGLELLEARVAEPLGDRRPDDDRIAGRHERPVAGCEGEHGVDRRRPTSRRAGHEADVATAPSRLAARSRPTACHDSRSSPRRSARSGSRSGTSRRSTRRPPRPPVTSIAKCRPRAPSRTVSRNRNSATADVPGGRSTRARPPGIEVELGRAAGRAVDDQRAGAPTGAHPGRRHDACRAGRAGRRRGRRSSPGARRRRGSTPSGARSRAWSRANWPAPGRRRTSTSARATVGAGATAQAPPVATTRSAAGGSAHSGVAFGQPAERRAGGGHPQRSRRRRVASAHGAIRSSRIRSRRRCRSAPHGRPLPDPIDDRVVGVGRGQRRGRDDRQVERRRRRRRRPARPTARVPAS